MEAYLVPAGDGEAEFTEKHSRFIGRVRRTDTEGEALEMLRGGSIPNSRRLVLLDLNMPKMNGLEFLREIRNDPQLATLNVVVLTTSNEDRDRVDAYQLNVAGYLLKPVTFHTFADVMATLNKYWTLMEMP